MEKRSSNRGNYRFSAKTPLEPAHEHERILQALEQRDPDGASYLMQLHIIRAADRVGITLKS